MKARAAADAKKKDQEELHRKRNLEDAAKQQEEEAKRRKFTVLWILEEKSGRLEPVGLALVTNKQIWLPGSGELTL